MDFEISGIAAPAATRGILSAKTAAPTTNGVATNVANFVHRSILGKTEWIFLFMRF